MADWVHCNKCYVQPTSNCKENKFLLTNCGHIYCEPCCGPSEKPHCHICRKNCSTILLNDSNLKQDIQLYFQDEDENIKTYQKVHEFQKFHRTRLITHLLKDSANLKRKYDMCKEYSNKLLQQNEALRKDNHKCKEYLNKLLKQIEALEKDNHNSKEYSKKALKALEALNKDNQRLRNAVKNCIGTPTNFVRRSSPSGSIIGDQSSEPLDYIIPTPTPPSVGSFSIRDEIVKPPGFISPTPTSTLHSVPSMTCIRDQGNNRLDKRNEWLSKYSPLERPSRQDSLPISQENFRTPDNRKIPFHSSNTGSSILSFDSTNYGSRYDYNGSIGSSPDLPISNIRLGGNPRSGGPLGRK